MVTCDRFHTYIGIMLCPVGMKTGHIGQVVRVSIQEVGLRHKQWHMAWGHCSDVEDATRTVGIETRVGCGIKQLFLGEAEVVQSNAIYVAVIRIGEISRPMQLGQ